MSDKEYPLSPEIFQITLDEKRLAYLRDRLKRLKQYRRETLWLMKALGWKRKMRGRFLTQREEPGLIRPPGPGKGVTSWHRRDELFERDYNRLSASNYREKEEDPRLFDFVRNQMEKQGITFRELALVWDIESNWTARCRMFLLRPLWYEDFLPRMADLSVIIETDVELLIDMALEVERWHSIRQLQRVVRFGTRLTGPVLPQEAFVKEASLPKGIPVLPDIPVEEIDQVLGRPTTRGTQRSKSNVAKKSGHG